MVQQRITQLMGFSGLFLLALFQLTASPRALAPVAATAALPSAADDFPAVYNSAAEAHLLPLPAEQAAATMQLPPGFQAEVFAAEPDVQNPIGMAWDERGRLWIAENYTYAERSQKWDLSLRDRVLVFSDTNHDGRPDQRTVFLDTVQRLTSVEIGRGGVWLMCPPQLLFVPDADQDLVPDGPAEVVLDGFEIGDSSYHNLANGLRWGPDGWLYGRCGHSCPGTPGVPGTPREERPELDGGIWRYHPERKIVEVLCHGTVNPWGHDWDSNGELFFINTVIGHLWHMIPGSHFRESFGESSNRHVYDRMDMIADHYHFDIRGRWSDSRDGRANDYGGGHAHIGMTICNRSDWPAEYQGRVLTLNMHGRRANVERIERTDTGYVGRHQPDLFVSADPFFRGIDLSFGPDGALYVIDWSDTGECHEHTGVHRLSGRIFRITGPKAGQTAAVTKPECLRGDGPLPKLWRDYQAGQTTADDLRQLSTSEDEHLRAWSIRLLTDFWPLDTITGPLPGAEYPDDPLTLQLLNQLAEKDSSGLVHRILASTLQRLPLSRRQVLAERLIRNQHWAADRDLPLLVWYGLIPLAEAEPGVLVNLAAVCKWPHLTRFMARYLAAESDSQLDHLLQEAVVFPAEQQNAVLLGMQDAWRGRRRVSAPTAWGKFADAADSELSRAVIRELGSLLGDSRAMQELRQIVLDPSAAMPQRITALQSMITADASGLKELCEQVLGVKHLNASAARGLSAAAGDDAAPLLLSHYSHFATADRGTVLEILSARPASARLLLQQIARQEIVASDLSVAHVRQLLSHRDEELNQILRQTWGELRDSPEDRLKLIASLRTQFTDQELQAADRSAGRLVFARNCSQCHQLYGTGQQVGPDLTGAQRSSLDYLLSNIVDPSALVSREYRMSVVILADGRVLNGLVVSRDEERVILRTPQERLVLAAEDIDEIEPTALSAMPDGLLQSLSQQQVRDLLAYLMSPTQVSLPAGTEE